MAIATTAITVPSAAEGLGSRAARVETDRRQSAAL